MKVKVESRESQYREWVKDAIRNLNDPRFGKGIHTFHSGFNKLFREKFGVDPVPLTQRMEKDGEIEIRPSRGGVILYLRGEKPVPVDRLAEARKKMGM